jgi:hypothetical protein
MSTMDTAKEIIRIGSTAGLSKDVIDLLERKVALLTDEITALTAKLLQSEHVKEQLASQLEKIQVEKDNLQVRLRDLQPKADDLEHVVLLSLAKDPGKSTGQIAKDHGLSPAKAKFVVGSLFEKDLIGSTSDWIAGGTDIHYKVLQKGLKLLNDHGKL